MEAVVERCAGIDIGKATLKATVRVQGGARRKTGREVRTFETTTPGLLALREWLVTEQVTLVGIESTGVFWKPIYYLLEDVVECWLLNARHLKKVPGRKTDVSDSEWIAELVAHGLVRPSFVPPRPIRRLRDLTRYRTALTQDRTREIQRLLGLLEDAGIKLSVFVSDITGTSARRMLAALIDGQRDPHLLAQLAQGRMRPKVPDLERALTGNFTDHHARLAAKMLAHIDELTATIAELTEEIDAELGPLRQARQRLTTIPGVSSRVAEVILAETGGTWRASPRPSSWRPGRRCARATTSQPVNTSAGARARAIVGYAGRWARLRPQRERRRAPTCRRGTGGWRRGVAASAPRSPSVTTSWLRPGTSWIETWTITTSVPTTSTDTSPTGNARRPVWPGSCRRWAIGSPSRPPRRGIFE